MGINGKLLPMKKLLLIMLLVLVLNANCAIALDKESAIEM